MAFTQHSAAALLFSLFLLATGNAEKINLPWCKPAVKGPYDNRVAKEGDTVVFEWGGEAHNAYVYPSGECLDNKDKEYLGEQSGASYTFKAEDIGTSKTFICSISNHCVVGQIVTFDVVAADQEVDYLLSTPCGEGYLGEEPAGPPVDESAGASLAVVGIAASLSVVGALFLV